MGSQPLVEVYVAAGGNIEPEKYLARALCELETAFGPLIVSPAYRNPAAGFQGEDFVNLVIGLRTALPAPQLRERLQQIERVCDRPPQAPKWAPRTMDLDILLYGQRVSDEPGLVFPRPDLLRRAYMLKPLADIAPELRHPIEGRTMRELWEAFDATAHPLVEVTIPRCGRRPPPGSAR